MQQAVLLITVMRSAPTNSGFSAKKDIEEVGLDILRGQPELRHRVPVQALGKGCDLSAWRQTRVKDSKWEADILHAVVWEWHLRRTKASANAFRMPTGYTAAADALWMPSSP